jgi:hypothetical protein
MISESAGAEDETPLRRYKNPDHHWRYAIREFPSQAKAENTTDGHIRPVALRVAGPTRTNAVLPQVMPGNAP